ncbi:MAG: methionyl-tRNA formyltransferase [Lachnospiraceae bacterium]|nr:methionyl-tRNA formyltransferase [Lachnospiraceae bacterium]
MRIVYMGTPDFAVGALEAIIEAGHEVTAVVTQPDKPKGRSGELIPSPVKEAAIKAGIPVFQPVRLRRPEAVEELKKYPADIYVVAAFGQILSDEVLGIPKYGCVNIHASLLPHLRGASPIQHAILQGDRESGVTIMQMDSGIDTGDILMQEAIPIDPDETGGSLFDKLADLGARMIVKALPLIETGQLIPVPQDEQRADHVGMLDKSMGRIDFRSSAEEIERRVRGLDPWPGAFTTLAGKQLKIWKSRVMSTGFGAFPESAVPGMVISTDRNSIYVACGTGVIAIDELQLEGKKRMKTADFLIGRKIEAGSKLGLA